MVPVAAPAPVTETPPAAPAHRAARPVRARGPRRFDSAGPLAYTMLAAVVVASLFPLYWTFVVASHGDNSVLGGATPSLVPGGHLIDNIKRVFDTVDFWKALGNSFTVSATTAVSNVLLSSLAGYAFAKMRFPGRDALLVVVVMTVMVPTQLGVLPLYLLVTDMGLYGKLSSLILPALVSAIGVFWMRQAMEENIPDELIEAARVDGAGPLRSFWYVAWPGVRSTAAVLGMFTFMAAWNDYFWPLIALPPENGTVQIALNQLAAGYYTDYTLMLAGVVVSVLPVLALFAVLARRIVSGVMAGAVKG
ncbi:carbohydrate ABC transporter permease [Streptomyces sp. DSM 41982]|uniref:Carbohydrate ABC transporter permease n=1 Tax=Streptomyces evansiae TaxID=3075535 RepID=A0ABD5E173_9ACTN|nr:MULTISPECIES: carbohydrate ABC transporter permease [unclassified Streptomyces]MDT0415094.1 carbohydrate ABC transporter permease [Streptomyces sp. DSM 41982]SCD99431.1 cellobiose ABC transporter membrane protein [Streptomyces sp. SolWspMP-sol7th]